MFAASLLASVIAAPMLPVVSNASTTSAFGGSGTRCSVSGTVVVRPGTSPTSAYAQNAPPPAPTLDTGATSRTSTASNASATPKTPFLLIILPQPQKTRPTGPDASPVLKPTNLR